MEIKGGWQMNNIRFDTENSKCVSVERMTPDELRQLHRMAIERHPESCLGCGLEHDCSVHGCAVIRKAFRLLGGESDAFL